MKAVVFHDVGDIRLEDVSEPKVEQPTDAIVRLTASAICGTDLHFVRGTVAGMKEGTVLGHEGVGIVEQVGESVRNIAVDRHRDEAGTLDFRDRVLQGVRYAATGLDEGGTDAASRQPGFMIGAL